MSSSFQFLSWQSQLKFINFAKAVIIPIKEKPKLKVCSWHVQNSRSVPCFFSFLAPLFSFSALTWAAKLVLALDVFYYLFWFFLARAAAAAAFGSKTSSSFCFSSSCFPFSASFLAFCFSFFLWFLDLDCPSLVAYCC